MPDIKSVNVPLLHSFSIVAIGEEQALNTVYRVKFVNCELFKSNTYKMLFYKLWKIQPSKSEQEVKLEEVEEIVIDRYLPTLVNSLALPISKPNT